MVPPVPTPATKMSTAPLVSCQISSAVVRAVHLRVGRVGELVGHEAVRMAGEQLFGGSDRSFHTFGGRGQHQLGAEVFEHHAALHAHGLRHGQDQLQSLGGADEGQAEAGVAAGRLDDDRVVLDQAVFDACLDHCHGDAALDAAHRVA